MYVGVRGHQTTHTSKLKLSYMQKAGANKSRCDVRRDYVNRNLANIPLPLSAHACLLSIRIEHLQTLEVPYSLWHR